MGIALVLAIPRGHAWPYAVFEGGFTVSGGAGPRGMGGAGLGVAAELGGLLLSVEAHGRAASLDFGGERFNEGAQYLLLGGIAFGR